MVARVLVACEFTGTVRDAFASRGFDAWSCDLEPSETPGQHIEDDALNVIHRGHWDLLIAHPPCTDLAISGARWFAEKGDRQEFALALVQELMAAPIRRIAIENPVSIISSRLRKPNQIIQPWWFGHAETKTTCLWLKNLPQLKATNPVFDWDTRRIHMMPESANRGRERSRTYAGVATAMAEQWGKLL